MFPVLAPLALALRLPPPLLSVTDPQLAAVHSFSRTASWLVPQLVLCGRYPGSCPSRPADADEVAARLEAIRSQSVDTFVCLQAELPPQDAPWPGAGVRAQSNNAIDVQTAAFAPYRDAAGRGATFVHFGIPDRSVVASLDALDGLVTDLARRVEAGDRLYLHCWGGQGRTGLVAACLLGALYAEDALDADGALRRVQRYFELREPQKGGRSPETDAQEDQVREWFARRRVLRLRGGVVTPWRRRYVLHVAVAGGGAGLIATRRAVAAACEQDRCRMEELLASGRVPASFKVLPLAASASWPCCCEPHPPLRPFPDARRR